MLLGPVAELNWSPLVIVIAYGSEKEEDDESTEAPKRGVRDLIQTLHADPVDFLTRMTQQPINLRIN